MENTIFWFALTTVNECDTAVVVAEQRSCSNRPTFLVKHKCFRVVITNFYLWQCFHRRFTAVIQIRSDMIHLSLTKAFQADHPFIVISDIMAFTVNYKRGWIGDRVPRPSLSCKWKHNGRNGQARSARVCALCISNHRRNKRLVLVNTFFYSWSLKILLLSVLYVSKFLHR